MKKQLLTLGLALLTTAFSFGQDFTQASNNTGLTYVGDNTAGVGYSWSQWFPDCAISGATNGNGGFDEAPTNELGIGWGHGVGFVYLIITLDNPLDLSNSANQTLKVTLRNTDGNATTESAEPLTYKLRLEDASNNSLINMVSMDVTGSAQTFTIDLGANIASGQNLSIVKKIIFLYDGCVGTNAANGKLYMSNLKVGSVIAGVNGAFSQISSSNLYPNPATSSATVSLDLKSNSNVKVVISDLMGREMKVVAEGNFANLNETFSVADLAKGLYKVTYLVDGVPAKSQSLMVK